MMVLVDTSVWIDHFRRGDLRLAGFLDRGNAVMHPFVLGELMLGHIVNEKFKEMLKYKNVGDVRGSGFFQGIDIVKSKKSRKP